MTHFELLLYGKENRINTDLWQSPRTRLCQRAKKRDEFSNGPVRQKKTKFSNKPAHTDFNETGPSENKCIYARQIDSNLTALKKIINLTHEYDVQITERAEFEIT